MLQTAGGLDWKADASTANRTIPNDLNPMVAPALNFAKRRLQGLSAFAQPVHDECLLSTHCGHRALR
jgi:hypothetical protein